MDFSLRNGKRAQRDEVVETFVCQRRDSYVNDDPCPREINNDAAGPAALASLVPAVNGDRCVRGIAAAAAAAGQTLTSLLPRRSIVYTRSRLTADSQTEIQMMVGGGRNRECGVEARSIADAFVCTRMFASGCIARCGSHPHPTPVPAPAISGEVYAGSRKGRTEVTHRASDSVLCSN